MPRALAPCMRAPCDNEKNTVISLPLKVGMNQTAGSMWLKTIKRKEKKNWGGMLAVKY
jgi:hypothetical protein